jgi:hypothetical protein
MEEIVEEKPLPPSRKIGMFQKGEMEKIVEENLAEMEKEIVLFFSSGEAIVW